MSDANPSGIVAGEQYAQASQTPVISAKTMRHIRRFHGPGALEKYSGKREFNAKFATPAGIKELVDDAFAHANRATVGPGDPYDRVVIINSEYSVDETGKVSSVPVGTSGRDLKVPSIETDTYVVVLDSDNNVITAYPINPADETNPNPFDPTDQAGE